MTWRAPAEGGKLGFERAHLRALDELAVRQYVRDRIVDGAAEAAALRRHVDERNRPLVKARVLVHCVFQTRWAPAFV